jgi:hypothetical protein
MTMPISKGTNVDAMAVVEDFIYLTCNKSPSIIQVILLLLLFLRVISITFVSIIISILWEIVIMLVTMNSVICIVISNRYPNTSFTLMS